jgi:predicted fused transcriptional regulator/phosphomethylpyrimidine kinase
MGFALPGAETVDEVCGIEAVPAEGSVLPACTSFGATRGMGPAILSAMRLDGRMRAGCELRFTEEHARIARCADLVSRVVREGHRSSLDSGIGAQDGLMHLGFVPDVVIYRGGRDNGPVIRMFAPSPEEVLGKLRVVLR